MNLSSIGILGVGTYLPDEVRYNDWWPAEVVKSWPQKMAAVMAHFTDNPDLPQSEGVARAIAGLRAFPDDPFFGMTERRVMPEGMMPSEMEARAGREAIERSGIDPQLIDVLLVHSMVPDYQTANPAAPVHHALGLSADCLCGGYDSVCNSFMGQLAVARGLIGTGQARYALLVQSSAVSRIADKSDWFSACLGDGATAVVVGPVAQGRGILSAAHRIDSSNCRGIVTGHPGGQWYEGRNMAMIPDKHAARRTLFKTPDMAREVLVKALGQAPVAPEAVDFYACHQVTGNLRQQTQEMAGMKHARFVDTLPWAGTLSSANIPLQLACAERERMLKDEDVVALFSMGSGSTGSAIVLKWGR